MVADNLCPVGSADRDGATTVYDSPDPSEEVIDDNIQAFTSCNPSSDEVRVSFVTVSVIEMDMDLRGSCPVFLRLMRVHQLMHLPKFT